MNPLVRLLNVVEMEAWGLHTAGCCCKTEGANTDLDVRCVQAASKWRHEASKARDWLTANPWALDALARGQ